MGLNLANPAKGEMDWDKKLADNFSAIVQYANANDLSISQVLAALDNKVEIYSTNRIYIGWNGNKLEAKVDDTELGQILTTEYGVPALNNGEALPDDVDIDDVKIPGLYYLHTSPLSDKHFPITDSACIVKVEKTGAWGYSVQQSVTYNYPIGCTYKRTLGTDGWSPWVKLATAESPTMYDLPLANTLVKPGDSHCLYFKSQDNIVTVKIAIESADGSPRVFDHETIAVLPVGFRPIMVSQITFTTYSEDARTMGAAIGYANADGTIVIHTGNAEAYHVMGEVTFVAA